MPPDFTSPWAKATTITLSYDATRNRVRAQVNGRATAVAFCDFI
jgi:hypothetical protein